MRRILAFAARTFIPLYLIFGTLYLLEQRSLKLSAYRTELVLNIFGILTCYILRPTGGGGGAKKKKLLKIKVPKHKLKNKKKIIDVTFL